MPVQNETARTGAAILSEGNGEISRDVVTISAGQNLQAGAVLGKVTASGEYVAYNNAATDGSEVAAGVLYEAIDATAAAQLGVAITRLAEVNTNELVWGPGAATQADRDAAVADLAALNIIAR